MIAFISYLIIVVLFSLVFLLYIKNMEKKFKEYIDTEYQHALNHIDRVVVELEKFFAENSKK